MKLTLLEITVYFETDILFIFNEFFLPFFFFYFFFFDFIFVIIITVIDSFILPDSVVECLTLTSYSVSLGFDTGPGEQLTCVKLPDLIKSLQINSGHVLYCSKHHNPYFHLSNPLFTQAPCFYETHILAG